jgi:hypothetical protein
MIETGDQQTKRVYKQVFKNNMSLTEQPLIQQQVT